MALAVCLAVVALPAPAQAHAALQSSQPSAGATLVSAPSDVVLTFNEEVEPTFVTVVVRRDGEELSPPEPATAGSVVTQPLGADAGPGNYEVLYRIVSTDGHPVEGVVAFTATAVAPTGPPSGTADRPPSERLATGRLETVESAQATGATDDVSLLFLGLAGLVLLLLVVSASVVFAVARRGRS